MQNAGHSPVGSGTSQPAHGGTTFIAAGGTKSHLALFEGAVHGWRGGGRIKSVEDSVELVYEGVRFAKKEVLACIK